MPTKKKTTKKSVEKKPVEKKVDLTVDRLQKVERLLDKAYHTLKTMPTGQAKQIVKEIENLMK